MNWRDREMKFIEQAAARIGDAMLLMPCRRIIKTFPTPDGKSIDLHVIETPKRRRRNHRISFDEGDQN